MPKLRVGLLSYRSWFLLTLFVYMLDGVSAHAEVKAITVQSPSLSVSQVTSLTSPIHVEATAEDTSVITGYVVYVDYQNVYRNFSPYLDAWIALPPGNHTLFVKAWDSQSNLETAVYPINIVGFAPPHPPANARRVLNISQGAWTVDNDPAVGGDCNHGSIGIFANSSDPNTGNLPAFGGPSGDPARGASAIDNLPISRGGFGGGGIKRMTSGTAPLPLGQHFIVNSRCNYDDSLFYSKIDTDPANFAGATNFLVDFWFYIPTTTKNSTVQAIEFDMFQALQMSDGVHEFMFGSQCNFATDQWQLWLPQGQSLTWVDAGISPCRFANGSWHHLTYFLQRVTPSGYQEIPPSFSPTADKNTSLRFGTLTIDGVTSYLGGVAWSTIPSPAWTPVLGVQHQLDSAAAGVTIEQYVGGESLTYW